MATNILNPDMIGDNPMTPEMLKAVEGMDYDEELEKWTGKDTTIYKVYGHCGDISFNFLRLHNNIDEVITIPEIPREYLKYSGTVFTGCQIPKSFTTPFLLIVKGGYET